jgi:Rgg/GadR/MutR family transcriptional activator
VDSTPAQSYLLNLEHWSLMDVILFSYFADQFTPTIKLRLLQSLLHHIPHTGLVQSWAPLLTDIVFGLFQQFMAGRQLDHAQTTLTIMDHLENRFNQTDDAILLLFMQGWLAYVQDKINQAAGKQQMDDAISILSILKYPQAAKKYRQLVNRITGIDSTPIVGDITFNR